MSAGLHATREVQLSKFDRWQAGDNEASVALPGAQTRATLSESTGLLCSDVIVIISIAARPVHCNVTMTASYNWCTIRKRSRRCLTASCATQGDTVLNETAHSASQACVKDSMDVAKQ